MKLLIFGATGGTGRQLVEQGLAKNYDIAAFVRNPAAITTSSDRLTVVKGDLSDYASIKSAMTGCDAVVSALGNKTGMAMRHANTIISDGLKNILRAMRETNVRRLIFITSFGVSETIFLPEKLFIRTFLKNIFADIPLQESLIRESGLSWTIVRPARLVDGPRTGRYKKGDGTMHIGLSSRIARADVADFILNSINDPATTQKIVTISY